ncbi:hypothetical protein ACFLSX_01455 [Calditrichota bacterium]
MVRCKFLGYDYNLIWVNLLDEGKITRALLSEIPEIRDRQGRIIQKEKISPLIDSGKIPTYSNLVLDINDVNEEINFSKIDFVKIYVSKNDQYCGLVAGAALDVTTLLLISINFKRANIL